MATAKIKNTAERRYWVSNRKDSSESDPNNILNNLADSDVKEHIFSNEYAGDQDDLKNKLFIDDQYIVSSMPETFNGDVKLDCEGRLYKHVGDEWHVYDMMDALPITDESAVPLTLDMVSGSAEYPSFSDISAGAASSHRLILSKDSSNIYNIRPIKYGVEYDAVGNSKKNVYFADVDYLVNAAFSYKWYGGAMAVQAYDENDGLFHCNETTYWTIDWTKIAFSYKPVYNIKVYAASDASKIRYVKLSTVSIGSESAEKYIAAETSSSDGKTFIIRNIDEANDASGSNFTIFRLTGTDTSPDQIMLEVW
jgi:hypothetical protein